MSNVALSWAWQADLPPTAKLVLVCLADRANDAGECFPSIADTAKRTGLAERSVQYALENLTQKGLLTRVVRLGKATIYRLHLDVLWGATDAGGARDAPLQEMRGVQHVHPGGATDAPGGCNTCTHNLNLTHIEPSPSVSEAHASPAAPPTRDVKGSRLSAEWVPDEPAYAGVDPHLTLARFRDYWTAQPGARGRKSDWQATWRNWCRREAERPKPKLHTLPAAEQDRRILVAAGLNFTDPPQPSVVPMRIAR